MTKKKKTETIPEPLALTRVEMLQLDRAHALVRAATSELKLYRTEKLAIVASLDPQGLIARIDGTIAHTKQEHADATAIQANARKEIETRLGINLAEFSYDDVTGALHKVGG